MFEKRCNPFPLPAPLNVRRTRQNHGRMCYRNGGGQNQGSQPTLLPVFSVDPPCLRIVDCQTLVFLSPFSLSSYILPPLSASSHSPASLVRILPGRPSVVVPFTDHAELDILSAFQTVHIHTSSNYEPLWIRGHNPSRASRVSRA